MRIHLIVNVHRSDALESAREAVSIMRSHRVDHAADLKSAQELGIDGVNDNTFGDCDLVVSFGGDGTLIRAAHLCSARSTPILGVYFGRFGFVTQCKPEEVGVSLSEWFDGKAVVEERMMLQADLLRGDSTVVSLHALNEVSLQRDLTAKMMAFQVEVDGRVLTSYPADGVLLSTPTGSTAYNLSAGGPIVDPGVQAIVLTAIAPHTLSSRPLVLKADSQVTLTLETEGDAVLGADGQSQLHLLSGDSVRVTRSPRVTRLISVDSHDFLVKLGERLLWSQRLVGNWQA